MSYEAVLRGIADSVKLAAGPGVGFALFLVPPNRPVSYVSNASREDVVKVLEEWLERTEGPLTLSGGPVETEEAKTNRLTLENRCAEAGKVIAQVVDVLLFFFDFGEGGHLGYFTSLADPRTGVRSWIDAQRRKA